MEEEWEQSKFRAIFSLVLGWALIPVIWFFGISRIATIDKSLVLFGTITFWSIIGIMTVATIWVTLKIREKDKGEKHGRKEKE